MQDYPSNERGYQVLWLKAGIFLVFCDFSIFQKKKHYKRAHVIVANKTDERHLDMFSFTFVDLVKFDKHCPKSLQHLTLEEKFYSFLCRAAEVDDQQLSAVGGKR